jgi:hypothetical protein
VPVSRLQDHRPAFFERARDAIEPVLAELGFSVAEEHYQQRSFGSAYCVYQGRRFELRVLWDGREGALRADYLRYGIWTNIESAELDTEQNDARIDRLVNAIRSFSQ